MSARLIRALERGGITSKIGPDIWGVWRGKDRRFRMIGKLSGAAIELLRMQKNLAPLGEEDPSILIWSGPARAEMAETPNARPTDMFRVEGTASLLQSLITKCGNPVLRSCYRRMAEAYRADVECLAQPGRMPGMNWDGLALGGRVDGGRFSAELKMSKDRAPAGARLARLGQRLSPEDGDLLDGMLLREETRSALAKRFSTRPSLIERRAISLMRSLGEVYHRDGT